MSLGCYTTPFVAMVELNEECLQPVVSYLVKRMGVSSWLLHAGLERLRKARLGPSRRHTHLWNLHYKSPISLLERGAHSVHNLRKWPSLAVCTVYGT